jgi:Predicted polymerase, most proteins contain PALM domain, HD hydrolase domain and Zn-ribbon domain
VANPLASFFPVEDRSDGVYIKVTREAVASLKVDLIIKALQTALVTNYNAARIQEIVQHSRGAFEKIGPLFEYYDPELEHHVDVGISPMKAVIKLSSTYLTDNVKATAGALVYCLNKKGVLYGIKTDIVGSVMRDVIFDKEVVIAEGKNPVAGQDAKIVMEVDIDHNLKPQQKTDGTVDYRNINTITLIKNGQVIAKKVPATKGDPGWSVTGQEIPPTPGNDVKFTGGKNTRVSDDGMYLLATKNGFIYKEGEVIHVGDVLPIAKDVDFSVGNIKYTGDVHIKGSVMPGFTVETEGNVLINGQVESARVLSRNGNVEIQKGIIGKGDTFVSAKNGIKTEFVQEAVLESEGTISVNKFCIHTEATCSIFEMKEPHSNLIGGSIRAFTHIEAYQVGNDKGVITNLSLVDRNELANREKLKELDALQKKLSQALEPVKKQLKAKAAILKNMGSTSDRMAGELKKWLNMYNDITLKMKYVDKNMTEIKEKLRNPASCDGYIKILGDIFPGSTVSFFGVAKTIKVTMTNKTFRMKDGSVDSEG